MTTAQLQALKADIAADPALGILPHSSDNADVISRAYNAPAVPDFFVWQTAVPIDDIRDQVAWASLTPTDAVPTDTALNAAIWQARSLACQGKQFNLQTLLMGKTTVDASKASLRQGLNDALTGLPSGAGGAVQAAGWTAVRLALQRKAKRAEKLFAAGAGTQAAPALLVFEGDLSVDVINAAWNS